MIEAAQGLAGACAGIAVRPETRTWFRAVQPQFWQTALASRQTLTRATRFNGDANAAVQFESLYLAENPLVALFEVEALYGDPSVPGSVIPHPQKAYIVLNVQVSLSRIADLTDGAAQASLKTSAQELTGDWRGYQQRGRSTTVQQPSGIAPTQGLGAAFHSIPGLEGFRTLSARIPYHEVLVVFPQKLQPGSYVRFSDAATGLTLSIP